MHVNIKLFLKVKKYQVKEQIQVISTLYNNKTFALVDLLFMSFSFFSNPYRVAKKFLKERGDVDIDIYGETPISSWKKIAKECDLKKEDTLFELGSGRGKGCFFLSSFVGCSVVGVELVPFFVKIAKIISKICGYKNLQFVCEDIHDVDLRDATFIYLYGSCFSDEEIKRLAEKFLKEATPNAKILTISYSLNEYNFDGFEVIKSFSLSFPWGNGEAFLHKIRNSKSVVA